MIFAESLRHVEVSDVESDRQDGDDMRDYIAEARFRHADLHIDARSCIAVDDFVIEFIGSCRVDQLSALRFCVVVRMTKHQLDFTQVDVTC